MSEKIDVKAEALPDLDDLLQCPVCYEIPAGQIFQCNEGHHVCGQCKIRLDVCPVCRALFFGTRNYAMEELIANIRKLRAFKLGGKVTTGSTSSESNTPAEDATAGLQNGVENAEDDNSESSSIRRAPQACKGLFRCLCCKNGKGERLPAARLLNHLRYFHARELLEGPSENGEYVQAWQFSTVPGRIVTAVRVSDMGIFFLVIEITYASLHAWLSMASAPWVAHEFCYTVTISGNDREAIFSDCVWSVRSCEGSLKKRGHCLAVTGLDAHALVEPSTICAKLSVRRAPPDQLLNQTQPRAVLRVASRGHAQIDSGNINTRDINHYLEDIVTLSREIGALRDEAQSEMRELSNSVMNLRAAAEIRLGGAPAVVQENVAQNATSSAEQIVLQPMSRNARRRMRRRLREALNVNIDASTAQINQNSSVGNDVEHSVGVINVQPLVTRSQRANTQSRGRDNIQNDALSVTQNVNRPSNVASQNQRNSIQTLSLTVSNTTPPSMVPAQHRDTDRQIPESVSTQPTAGPSNRQPQNTNGAGANKKKRRQRR